ncbi:hypothetical protein [Chryseobacterium profundimaris]|uniref:DUF4347 domain-containing protein n=1 Tax=Chryseobacterium profundimaris TaxID=1387275 RepID=A0ABY1PAT3_9FLAO|nr:hypothetical protein [Chryseobacterium profundimaris]SMP30275.1 hypothetical protein SAMN06264346_112111 [Chryseobacterium profundimaris]
MAIDIIVTIITIIKGIAKLAKQLSKFVKWINEVLVRGGKGARKVINKIRKITLEEALKWKKEDWLTAKILKFSDDGATFRNSIKLLQREEENIFNIVAHGSNNGKFVDYSGTWTKAEDYANIIKAEGWIEGTPIRLVSCYSGSLKNGFAAKLAKILKVEVEAPTLKIRVDDLGNFVHDKNGKFIKFKP